MTYVIDLWAPPALEVYGSDKLFPVRRIHCVAKNYGEHIREMGGDPDKVKPKFFSKSAHALVAGKDRVEVAYPKATRNLHFEAELVVCLGENAQIIGYASGIDFTKRDLQSEAREASMPWDTAKNFSGAACVSAMTPLTQTGPLSKGAIRLLQNGDVKQDGDLAQMIYGVPDIIEHLEGYDPLLPGDIIFTGTPAGVGACQSGDSLQIEIEGLPGFEVAIR